MVAHATHDRSISLWFYLSRIKSHLSKLLVNWIQWRTSITSLWLVSTGKWPLSTFDLIWSFRHDLTVGLSEIWSKFKIEIAASDQGGNYRKKQKYLMQFHSFIKEIEIIGRDPERLFHSNIPTRSGKMKCRWRVWSAPALMSYKLWLDFVSDGI